jgi:2,3-bisphosphoglycerate-independent phosphoglycerate mutase
MSQQRAQAAKTAAIINHLSDCLRQRLDGHPINAARAAAGKNVANVVLLRGCGALMDLPSFQDKHGVKGCIVAPTKVLGGVFCGLFFRIVGISQAHFLGHA